MKVLIAAAAFSSGMSGIQRHAFNVVRCLLRRSEISAIYFVVAPWQHELVLAEGLHTDRRFVIHVDEMGRESMARNAWYYWRLPRLARALHSDIVHLSYPVPVNAAAYVCPTVVTLHDLYPYEIPLNFGFPKFIFNQIVLGQCLRNTDAIACVSSVTRRRLRQYASSETWAKSLQIYNCVECEPLATEDAVVEAGRNVPFLLCVAQHRRNKNIPLLLRAFHRLLRGGRIDGRMNLFIVGIRGPETRRIHRLVAELGMADRVYFFEGLTDAQLQWCYRHGSALVAPSSTEGFGLPIAEALLAGCRVVCADIPAFREVGGDQCLFVSLGDEAEQMLADGIVASLASPARQPVPLPQLSASVLAEQYIALYRKLLAPVAVRHEAELSASLHVRSERQSL